MGEMSLIQQIKQVDDVMQYIILICKEAEDMDRNVSDTVAFLRQNGLRTETADKIKQVYMGTINNILWPMLTRMRKCDYEYLKEIRNNLEIALNR